MANRRMISKRISISERVNSVSDFAKLLFTWTIPHTDDWGRIDGSPKKIKAIVMPLSTASVKKFEATLKELANSNLIIWYEIEKELFIQILGFEDHQTHLEKRTASKFPDLPSDKEKVYPSANFCELLRTSPLTKPNLTKPNLIKPNSSDYFFDFEALWSKYPRKLGKTDAEKHFRASIKNQVDFEKITRALENYLKDINLKGIEERYIQHGSTWFYKKWQDWVEYIPKGKPTAIDQAKEHIEELRKEREVIDI